MPKRRDQMTDEEYEAVKARMAELRVTAAAKRTAMASEKRQTDDDLKAVKSRELVAKQALTKTKVEQVERLEKRVAKVAAVAPPEEDNEDEEVVVVTARKPKKRIVVQDSSDDEDRYTALKRKMKEKCKKYVSQEMTAATKMTAAPAPPVPMPSDLLNESAREQLNDRVRKEVKEMAYMSVFPDSFW